MLYFITATVFGPLLLGEDKLYLVGITATGLLAAVFANWLALRIWENRSLFDLGLWWRRESSANLTIGLLGGAGSACLVLGPPLLSGIAHFVPTPRNGPRSEPSSSW